MKRNGFVLAIMAIAMLGACSKPAEKAPEKSNALSVNVVPAETGAKTASLRLPGSVAPWEEMRLGVEIAGYRVAEVLVEPGAIVARGQTLLTLDARMIEVELTQARAQVAQAEANLELARANAQRGREMLTHKLIARAQAEEWLAGEKTAAAAVEVAKAALAGTRLRHEFTTLRAPHAGVIATRTVEPGQIVNPGDTLMTLVRDARLEWRAEVTEANLLAIEPGQRVRLRSLDGQLVEGRVRTRSPGLDARTRTGLVYVDLADPKSLRAGMFVEGEIELGEVEALRIPSSALVLRDGYAYVFVVDDKQRARERRIEIGDRLQGLVAVRSGLSAGERVVSKGAAFLGDGDKVNVVEAQGQTP